MTNIKIIAEIGWNHLGDMDLAEKMIISAANNGAQICKFQSWSVKNLKKGPWDSDGRLEIYNKAELSFDDHVKLIQICKDNSVQFMTSIFNSESIAMLKKLNINFVKIPSHENYNTRLVTDILNSFNSALISTGASKWTEIEQYINHFKHGNLIPMHCVSSYPCNPENINLPKISELRKISNIYGYSGHLQTIDDAISAISLGCSYVEKHFTIDKSLPGRDNQFAILPKDLKNLSNFRDIFEKMNINKGSDFQDGEIDIIENYRGRWGG
jgi:N,N'-diacetyllegionaminate synthase